MLLSPVLCEHSLRAQLGPSNTASTACSSIHKPLSLPLARAGPGCTRQCHVDRSLK